MSNCGSAMDDRTTRVRGILRTPRGGLALVASATVVLAAVQLGANSQRATPVPAFVNHALGAPQPHAPLTHRPARNLTVTILPRGFTFDAGAGGALTLTEAAATAAATRFANGTLARTSYGNLAVTVDKAKARVETLSTVDHRLGFRTWQWRLDTRLEGRVADSGWVGFFDRTSNRLQSVSIPPVQIFDAHGHDVTPKGTHWGLVTTSGQQYPTLSRDDSGLPLPYTIDPGALRTSTTATSTAGSGTFTITIPSTVNAKDLLLIQETSKETTATATVPSVPTDGTTGGNTWASIMGTAVANATIEQYVFWKWAVSGDASQAATVTIQS